MWQVGRLVGLSLLLCRLPRRPDDYGAGIPISNFLGLSLRVAMMTQAAFPDSLLCGPRTGTRTLR